MDYQIEIKYKKVLKDLEANFGEDIDMDAVLFLIGVQELGMGYKKFSKRQKLELMHVGMCTILMPFGFYSKEGRDKDNWPHFKLERELPALNDSEQNHLIKEAIISYFEEMNSGKPTTIDIRESLRNIRE